MTNHTPSREEHRILQGTPVAGKTLSFLDSLPGPGWWNWKDGWCEWAGPGVPGVSNFSDKVEACPYRVSVSKDTRSGVWNLLLARDHRLWKEHGEFPDDHCSIVVRFYLKSAPALGWVVQGLLHQRAWN